jgi:hypothetical protein
MFITFLIISLLLVIDSLSELINFRYTYTIFIQRRTFKFLANSNEDQKEHFLKLRELESENSNLRQFIKLLYIPWVIFCFISKIWFLPFITSIIYFYGANSTKDNIETPRIIFFIMLLVIFCTYLFSVVSLLMKYF